MLLPRGLGRPGLEPLQRYGSWPAYYALLSLSLVPFLTFFVASLAALAQLLRHRASYLWPLVLGGQLIAYGALYGQALQPHLRPLVRGRADHAFASVVDVGASLLAHAGFATLCRLAWSVVPAAGRSSSSSSSPEAARLLREWRVGCALLVPHALSGAAVLLLWWPAAAACTPFAQLPFCAYFAAVAFDYRRLAREWAAKEGEEGEELGAGRPRECGRLFDAMVVVAGAMTVGLLMLFFFCLFWLLLVMGLTFFFLVPGTLRFGDRGCGFWDLRELIRICAPGMDDRW